MNLSSLLSSPRRSERVAIDAEILLGRSGQPHYRVRIHDASPHGCRADFIERPLLDERVWVKFDGLDALEAEVCWIDGFRAGLNFVQPLQAAVFEQLIAQLRRR